MFLSPGASEYMRIIRIYMDVNNEHLYGHGRYNLITAEVSLLSGEEAVVIGSLSDVGSNDSSFLNVSRR